MLLTAGLAMADARLDAKQILDASGIKGGLVVHLGCGDGKLTAALRANGNLLIHGLDAEARNVAAARQHIQSLKLYGPVAVEQWQGTRLPYTDNLVNLIVVSGDVAIERDELLRALAPGGVAFFANRKPEIENRKLVKPRPAEIDEWTHFLHDAGGNPVARDRVVGPPRHVQWTDDPQNMRSHEHTPGLAALVSSGGRIFYIVDEAPASSILRSPEWHLVARDAHNGVQLWKRPITVWWPHILGWTQGPRQLQRRLVAVGDRVYVTLGLFAPLHAVDAVTGKTLQVYDHTTGTEEVVWHNGTLLLAVREVTEDRKTEREKWAQLSKVKDSPLFNRDSSAPLIQQLRHIDSQAELSLMALEAASGRLLWKRTGQEVEGLKPLTLSATGGKAFFEKAKEVVCVDLKTGKKSWSAAASKMRSAGDYGVVCADDDTVSVLSAQTGKPLWVQKPALIDIRDAFVINDTLWLGGFKPWQGKATGKRGPAWGPYFVNQLDLASGKLLKAIDPENPGHHHRCYVNKATERFILGGRRGTEFIDLQTGEVLWHSWARGVCMYGVMPCNGLFYVPPHACGCYVATKLTGFNALANSLAGERKPASGEAGDTGRLERGPAFADISNRKSQIANSTDWPAYRHDAERSGTTPTTVPTKLKRLWQTDLGGRLTAPTVAGGKVFVSSVDEHRVCALDADSGQPKWSFTAGGRVDTPPTVQGDRAVFGCRDGHVYNLRAEDGVPAWRLRVARDERRIVAQGQVESALPAHGSVLIREGVAYVTAGRSSYVDGGIDLCRVEVASGKILSRTPIYSPDPETGKQPPQYGPNAMPGARSDLLASDGENVYLRDLAFSRDGLVHTNTNPHLLTLTGFLDDTWPHRSYWIFGTHTSLATGCSSREKDLIYGRLLVFNGTTIYGYGRKKVDWSNQLLDGPYRLFATSRTGGSSEWEKPMPIQVRTMVLADKVLFVAGPPVNTADLTQNPDPSQGALLLAVSTTDGAELGRCRLDSPPVFDSLAVARGRLYLTTVDGKVLCLADGR